MLYTAVQVFHNIYESGDEPWPKPFSLSDVEKGKTEWIRLRWKINTAGERRLWPEPGASEGCRGGMAGGKIIDWLDWQVSLARVESEWNGIDLN
jgi:hypothetical protein